MFPHLHSHNIQEHNVHVYTTLAFNIREATKTMYSVASGLGLGAPLKDSHRLCDYPMEVPFTGIEVPYTKKGGLAPS